MKISRTSLAVVLLLLAGGLSAPALVGPMLVNSPAQENISPAPPARVTAALRAAADPAVPRFGRDVTSRSTGPVPELGGVELGRALGTTIVPEAFVSQTAGVAGGTGWASGSGGVRRSTRAAERGVFGGGGGIAGGTPGLLGWGLRDARGSAAAIAATTGQATRAATRGTQRAAGSGGGGGASGGATDSGDDGNAGSDDVAGGPAGEDTDAGTASGGAPGSTVAAEVTTAAAPAGLLGGAGAGGSGVAGGNMPAATPEPATLLLVGSGAALAGLYRSRRRSR